MSDHELLHAYASCGSEQAFTELVRRHAGAVRAAALRQTCNPDLAEEVTHAVFLQLARKAASIRPSVILIGWLLKAARYAAIDAVRAEGRRHRREAEFVAMLPTESPSADAESESLWMRVAPHLDEALMRLRAVDRDALLLRFFDNKPLAAVGAALGVHEDAARKRVHRALERLQAQLKRRGTVAPASVLPGLLSTHAAPSSSADLVDSAARLALLPVEPATSIGGLASGIGWRMLVATCRPWLIGSALVVAGATATGIVVRQQEAPRTSARITVDDDYRRAGFPDAAVVQRFVADLQRGLRDADPDQLARQVRFPMRVNSSRGTRYVPDAAGFVAQYDSLFRPEVVGVILKSPNRRLFCDDRGVMVGDGTLWIAPETAGEPRPRIIALNLPY